MIEYNIDNLSNILNSNKEKVVLFGAGDFGEICFYSLKQKDINVDFFCDNSEKKQGKYKSGKKILSLKELNKLSSKTNVFISNNYASSIVPGLKKNNFSNIYSCLELMEKTDFTDSKLTNQPLKIERMIAFHRNMCMKEEYISNNFLDIKSLDVQITERCSLKCKDCSNLMQYYTNPEHNELDLMFKSIKRFMACVDNIYEFRVIGGDPFVHKGLHKVIDHLVEYEKIKKIAIYTNARIIPKKENLECLKNEKVILDISDYGLLDKKKRKADELMKICDDNNIKYSIRNVTVWQDCGRILPFQKRTEEERVRVFNNCCNSDLLSLLHGKLYRCPFSANATNLKAIPHDDNEIVDLGDETIPFNVLKDKIKELTYDKKYLTACHFCNGRDYKTPAVDAAVQTLKPFSYTKLTN